MSGYGFKGRKRFLPGSSPASGQGFKGHKESLSEGSLVPGHGFSYAVTPANRARGLHRLRKNSEWTAKGRNLGDVKPSTNPRGSFLGRPGTICFSHFLRNRVFPQPVQPLTNFSAVSNAPRFGLSHSDWYTRPGCFERTASGNAHPSRQRLTGSTGIRADSCNFSYRLRPDSSVVERGPEKAGVGGSIPSLATTFCNNLGRIRENTLTRSSPVIAPSPNP